MITLWQVTETLKDKHEMAYMWNVKNCTNDLICKTETESEMQKRNSWLSQGIWGGGGVN